MPILPFPLPPFHPPRRAVAAAGWSPFFALMLVFSMACSFSPRLLGADPASSSSALPLAALARPGEFVDLGIAAPLVPFGGAVATINRAGERLVILSHAQGLLVVNLDHAQQINYPWPELEGPKQGGFSFFLSSANRCYWLRDGHLLEFDLENREWRTVPAPLRAAMAMAEGEDGTIYAGLYPGAELLAFQPETGKLTTLTRLREEEWPVYVSRIAIDRKGWLYAATGYKNSTIIAYHLEEGRQVELFPEHWSGSTNLYTSADGEVFVEIRQQNATYRLFDGQCERVEKAPQPGPGEKLAWVRDVLPDFGDGSRIRSLSFEDRVMEVQLAGRDELLTVTLDYPQPTSGRSIYSMTLGGDGAIYGSTGLPLRLFRFAPADQRFEHWGSNRKIGRGHINRMLASGHLIYGAIYSGGYLMAFDTTRPWREPLTPGGNPRLLSERLPINRPHALALHKEKALLLAGTPAYGKNGAGLLVHELEGDREFSIGQEKLVPGQSTFSLAILPGGDVIGGTTIAPGTGGTPPPGDASLYRLDWKSRKVRLPVVPIPGATEVSALLAGGGQRVYGLARLMSDREEWALRDAGSVTFFILDTETMQFTRQEDLSAYGPLAGVMAPQVLLPAPEGKLLVLFKNAIVEIDPATGTHRQLAAPPSPISEGGGISNGQLFYAAGSRLMVYGLPSGPTPDKTTHPNRTTP